MGRKLLISIIKFFIYYTLLIIVAVMALMNEFYYPAVVVIIISVFVAIKIVRLSTAYVQKIKFIVSAIGNKDYMFNFVEENLKDDVNTYLNLIKKMLENARKEVEINEEYYQHIIDNISSGIIVTNVSNNILKTNQAVRKLLTDENIPHLNVLSEYYEGLGEVLIKAEVNMPQTFTIATEKEQLDINILLTHWKQNNKLLKIFTINNISSEMEYKEMESWHKLTRVLTHEIMNMLTPITTLSSSLCQKDDIVNSKVKDSLQLISSTSQSLVKFVNNYRELSRIAPPVRRAISVSPMIHNAMKLFEQSKHNIHFSTRIPNEHLMIFADENLILQVIINLIKNAVEAIDTDSGHIVLSAYSDKKEDVIIKVTDSGKSIDEKVAENIFIPFFTTKEGGSGIGLSISRQIMNLHNGSIKLVQHKEEKSFILRFR